MKKANFNAINAITRERVALSSPSLAEGARGWVNPAPKPQAKSATANEYATSSLRASKASVAIQKNQKERNRLPHKSCDLLTTTMVA